MGTWHWIYVQRHKLMSLQDSRDNLSIRVPTYTTNSMDQLCPILLLSYAPGSAVSHESIHPEWTNAWALMKLSDRVDAKVFASSSSWGRVRVYWVWLFRLDISRSLLICHVRYAEEPEVQVPDRLGNSTYYSAHRCGWFLPTTHPLTITEILKILQFEDWGQILVWRSTPTWCHQSSMSSICT